MRITDGTATVAIVAALAVSVRAVAKEAAPPAAPEVTCATLMTFTGEVQILDSTRTRIIDTEAKSPVPCGGWISIDVGWVELKHKDGHEFRLGTHTFVEVPLRPRDGGAGHDAQLVLYKGKFFAQAPDGAPELRVVTPNAILRLKKGSLIGMFSHTDEETQLISLDRPSTLENRFEGARRIEARPGEATSLVLGATRVIPSTPRAVMISSLKMTLLDLNFTEDEQRPIVKVIRDRQDQKFPAMAVPDTLPKRPPGAEEPKIAVGDEAPKDPASEKRFLSRLTGGHPEAADALLFPKQREKKDEKAQARGPASDSKTENKGMIRSEKQKLIEELTKIRAE